MILNHQQIKQLYEKIEKETKGQGHFKIAQLLYSTNSDNQKDLFFNYIKIANNSTTPSFVNMRIKEKTIVNNAINNNWESIPEVKVDDLFYDYCLSLDKKTLKLYVSFFKDLKSNLVDDMQKYNIKKYKKNLYSLKEEERNDDFVEASKVFMTKIIQQKDSGNNNIDIFIKTMDIIIKNKNNIKLIVKNLENAFKLSIKKEIIRTWIKSFISNHSIEKLKTIQEQLSKEDLIDILGDKGYHEWLKNNEFNGIVTEETLSLSIKIDLNKIKQDKTTNTDLIKLNFKRLYVVIDDIYKDDLNYCGCHENHNTDQLELFILYKNNDTLIKDVALVFLDQILSYKQNRGLNEMTEDFIKIKNKHELELKLENKSHKKTVKQKL